MSVLMVNEFADFKTLKEILGATDGNLASHAKALEKATYIRVEKQFVGRKPNTRYYATDAGKEAFEKHIEALERLLKKE
jgi:DNA-binding MarR family transcriptional regulator